MWEIIVNKYKEKTEKVMGKSLMENQGIFMVISGLFPLNSFYTIFVSLILFYMLCLFVYTCIYFYYYDINLALFSETAHFVMVVFCGFSFYVVFWFQKERVYKISMWLDREFYKYGDTIDPETKLEIKQRTNKMKNRKSKISQLMTTVYITCGTCAVLLFPLIFKKTTIKESSNNVLMNTPVVCYYPVSGDLGWYLCVLNEYLSTFFIITALNGSDVAFSCFCEEGCNQLDILSLTIRNGLMRARYVYKKKYGIEPTILQEERFSYCVKKCFDESVKHHYAIIYYFQEVQSLFSWCVMVVMMAGAIMLCLSGLYFFLDLVELGTKLCFLFYLSGELMHTFIYAWYGQKMSEMSSEIREVLYEVEWEECSQVLKPYVLIMQAYTNTPIKLKGGGLMEYNLNTFGSVCSSAYSYFNLVSAAVHSDVTS